MLAAQPLERVEPIFELVQRRGSESSGGAVAGELAHRLVELGLHGDEPLLERRDDGVGFLGIGESEARSAR